ncbi:MAG: hypothetical protein VZR53_20005 [Prevotella sp.]|nr:hypothetical protein [Prevotella sp.]
MDRTVEYLLRKYETKDVNEVWTTEHELEYKRNQRNKKRLHTLDGIVNERITKSKGTFIMPKSQKDRARYLIRHLDFYLGRTTEEQYIVMIIIYVKLESNHNARVIHYYPMLEEYNIPVTTFIKFLINLNKFHIEH